MQKDVKRYYREHHQGGRNSLARAIDALVLRAVLALGCWLWFRYHIANQIAAILLTVFTATVCFSALHLWRGLRFEKFIQKETERLRDIVLRERLLLLTAEDFQSLCKQLLPDRPENVLLLCSQRAAPLDEDAALEAYRMARTKGRTALLIFSLSPCTAKTTLLLSRLPIPATCIHAEQILCKAKELPAGKITGDEVDAYILEQQRLNLTRKERTQTQPFSADRSKKYLLCAAILFAVSFVTGYTLYYRLLAGLCLALSGTAFFLNRPTNPQKEV